MVSVGQFYIRLRGNNQAIFYEYALVLSVAIALIITLTACSNGDGSPKSTFPNIDDAKIPDALELTVGKWNSISLPQQEQRRMVL